MTDRRTKGGAMACGDHAFTSPALHGDTDDSTCSGALSFLSRRFTRDLAGIDVVISGIAYDLGTSPFDVERQRGRSSACCAR